MPGHVNALAVATRIAVDVVMGRCGVWQVATLEAEAAKSSEVAACLASAQAKKDRTVAAAAELVGILRHPSIPLLLLDSAPWPSHL